MEWSEVVKVNAQCLQHLLHASILYSNLVRGELARLATIGASPSRALWVWRPRYSRACCGFVRDGSKCSGQPVLRTCVLCVSLRGMLTAEDECIGMPTTHPRSSWCASHGGWCACVCDFILPWCQAPRMQVRLIAVLEAVHALRPTGCQECTVRTPQVCDPPVCDHDFETFC